MYCHFFTFINIARENILVKSIKLGFECHLCLIIIILLEYRFWYSIFYYFKSNWINWFLSIIDYRCGKMFYPRYKIEELQILFDLFFNCLKCDTYMTWYMAIGRWISKIWNYVPLNADVLNLELLMRLLFWNMYVLSIKWVELKVKLALHQGLFPIVDCGVQPIIKAMIWSCALPYSYGCFVYVLP